jgi:hypothetical protein
VEEDMLHTFTLHEDAWFRDEDVFANGQVTGYRVGGMPDGKTARIANFGAPNRNDWRIMRMLTHRPIGPVTTKVSTTH